MIQHGGDRFPIWLAASAPVESHSTLNRMQGLLRSQDVRKHSMVGAIREASTPSDALYARAIRENTGQLASRIMKESARPVWLYPSWIIRDLAIHLGTVHRRASHVLANESQHRPSSKCLSAPSAPSELAEWLKRGAASLLDRFNECTATRVWTFGTDTSPRFWLRRMATETTLHRWDADHAAGDPSSPSPELAIDAIDEFLDVYLRRNFASRRWD